MSADSRRRSGSLGWCGGAKGRARGRGGGGGDKEHWCAACMVFQASVPIALVNNLLKYSLEEMTMHFRERRCHCVHTRLLMHTDRCWRTGERLT